MGCTNHPGVTVSLVRCAGCLRRFCRHCVDRAEVFYYCKRCRVRAPAAEPRAPAAMPAEVRDDREPLLEAAGAVAEMEPAALSRRAIALVVDCAAVWFVLVVLFSLIPAKAEVLRMLLVVGLPIAYEALFLQQTGQTLGKSMLDIQVVSHNGDSVGDAPAWLRGAVKLAQFACCGLAFLSALFSDGRRALHDHVAKTRVVNAGSSGRRLSLAE